MIRTISAFERDEKGDWVAELSCWHRQHVRHLPPFQERQWVLSAEGRASHVGSPIECGPCDRAELPDGLSMLAQAGPWDQDSVPAGLRKAHLTPAGRWGRLCVAEGGLSFQFYPEADPPGAVVGDLQAGSVQIIPPAVPHQVILTGPARLHLEFWGRPSFEDSPD